MTLKERILELLASAPGLSDRELTDRLLRQGAHPAPVNQAARQLAGEGRLVRRSVGGAIGNYPVIPGTGALAPVRAPSSRSPEPAAAARTSRGPLDIEASLGAFLAKRTPGERYASFDYCFNYFQSHREQGKLGALLAPEHVQLSCLQLGFYLASWGMFRRANLLQRSVRHYIPVIEEIANAPAEVWEIDADGYGDGSCPLIFGTAERIMSALANNASRTLLTKVMLGTFGCVPAFDRYFKSGFGVATFAKKALRKIGKFYDEHQDVIERNRVPTLDFSTGQPTQRRYTRAKVIDMIFFVAGGAGLNETSEG